MDYLYRSANILSISNNIRTLIKQDTYFNNARSIIDLLNSRIKKILVVLNLIYLRTILSYSQQWDHQSIIKGYFFLISFFLYVKIKDLIGLGLLSKFFAT